MHLFQHKEILFMVYLLGMLIESIASDGPAGPKHCQCFRVDASVGAGGFYKQKKKL